LHTKNLKMKEISHILKNTFSFYAGFALILLFMGLSVHAETSPKREVRAVWITTIGGLDWPHSYSQSEYSAHKQQKELCDILDKLKAANINTVLIQTRIRGTVIYPSRYEPWDGCLSGFPGKSPGYDPLQFAINECHRRGIELHAWVVTMPIGKWSKLGASDLRKKHPELCRKIGDEGYMYPDKKGTADYIASICREITENYDIDGIHLDYIRYPETYPLRGTSQSRRDNITRIVTSVHDAVKSVKPWIKMSCSPVGKYNDLSRYWSHGWNAYETVGQDAQGWLRDGLMDQLYPMMYFQGDQFFPFAIDWQECSYGRTVSPGLGIYFLDEKEKDWNEEIIQREMYVLRSFGLGHAYFRSKFFTDNTKGIYDFAADEIDRHPALVPAMTWEHKSSPSAPVSVSVTSTDTADIISWDNGIDHSGGPYLTYNVYASDVYPVDVNDMANLMASRIMANAISLRKQDNLKYYAVTAMDRYGNESQPVSIAETRKQTDIQLFKNDGRRLQLPSKPSILDADHLVITNIAGTITAVLPYNSNTVNITNISSGVYTVSSLNEKGVTHRLGMFIKRQN
jgi:uncharacterized lipoprotein YddW (UPF0748 family)